MIDKQPNAVDMAGVVRAILRTTVPFPISDSPTHTCIASQVDSFCFSFFSGTFPIKSKGRCLWMSQTQIHDIRNSPNDVYVTMEIKSQSYLVIFVVQLRTSDLTKDNFDGRSLAK